MGLDMYLYRKTYVPSYDGHGDTPEERLKNSTRGKLQIKGLKSRIDPKKVAYIVEDVGYWRKANQIHQWFVEHVQDGEDDCKSYYVSREQLEELLETVEKVLASTELVDGEIHAGTEFKDGKSREIIEKGKVLKDPTVAKELLPTQAGFFFGGYDYDEWYWRQLEETKQILVEALKANEAEFEYGSSW